MARGRATGDPGGPLRSGGDHRVLPSICRRRRIENRQQRSIALLVLTAFLFLSALVAPVLAARQAKQVDYAGHVKGLGGPSQLVNLHVERSGKKAGVDLLAPCGEFTGSARLRNDSFTYKYTASNGNGASARVHLSRRKATGTITTWGKQHRCDEKNIHFSIPRSSS